MVRLSSVALILLSLPAAAWSAPPSPADTNPTFHLPQTIDHQRFAPAVAIGKTSIGPNAQFGFGVFGLKAEKTHLRPVTVGEINVPKQRRAAVGFSLKF